MNMRKLIASCLRRLKINRKVLKILLPFKFRKKHKLMTYDEAIKRINSYSADEGCSALNPTQNTQRYNVRDHWDLDIIIPCYNSEATIRKCIESCLNQDTSIKYRLIIVDDGSKDSTATIIDEYAGISNILIVHQENRGFSGARNAGLDLCNSLYVMFVDSDDFLPTNSVQALMSIAIQKNAEVVGGGYCYVDKQGNAYKYVHSSSGRVNPRNELGGQPWAKVFKSQYFDNVHFPENYWYEDSIFSQLIYPMVEKNGGGAYSISDNVYCYYSSNPVNITNTGRYSPKCIDSYYITQSLYADREKMGIKIDQEYYEYILRMISLTYSRTIFVPKKVEEALFVVFRDFFVKDFKGFHTKNSEFVALEEAVRKSNFCAYRCILLLM